MIELHVLRDTFVGDFPNLQPNLGHCFD